MGYEQVLSVMESPSLSHKLHGIFSLDLTEDLHLDVLSSKLAMSESTLY
jgi:hypothetical protein